MRLDPYRIVEGAAIAALAVGASDVFLATKAAYAPEVAALRRAALELSGTGLLLDLTLTIVEGPDEYLFGEEKALLEVIEGHDPLPRTLPPYQHGLFATVPIGWEAGASGPRPAGRATRRSVNNVETLATAAHILARGADWFRTMGTAGSPGTLLATVVGDVAPPAGGRGRHGHALRRRCWPAAAARTTGARWWRRSPACPTRCSRRPTSTCHSRTRTSPARGSGLGAAGFVVYDDTADMVSVARELEPVPGRRGVRPVPAVQVGFDRDHGAAARHRAGRRAATTTWASSTPASSTVTDANRCYLGTEEQNVVSSILRAFPEAFAARLEGTAGPLRPADVPLVKDIADDGTVTYDERHVRKQLDWTYR